MKLKQNRSLIIGSKKDISKLAVKDNARLLLISDSHGNTERFISIVNQYGKDCDALIFCGDGFVDLSVLLKSPEILTPPVIAYVQGNCDPSELYLSGGQGGFFCGSLKAPIEQNLVVNGKKILIVHGHAHGIDYGKEKLGLQMRLNEDEIAFYGHTHIASDQRAGNIRFINPGSCSRPRGGQCASFAIATIGKTFVDVAFINAESFEIWQPLN